MPAISESAVSGQKLLESGAVKYIETPQAPPAIPAPTNAYPAAPNQYLRAPLPDDMWQQPDGQRQFHIAAIPQTRISPLPENTNPVVGAQAATQAIQIVATTPVTSSGGTGTVTSVGLTMPPIFASPVSGSPITTAGTLAPAFVNEPFHTVFAGPTSSQGNPALDIATVSSGSVAPNSTATITFNGATTNPGDFALLAVPAFETGDTVNTQPDGSWTQINAIAPGLTGGGVFWKVVSAAGNISASASYTTSAAGTARGVGAALVTLFASGTPTVRQNTNHTIASVLNPGQTDSFSFGSNTLASSTILLVIQGGMGAQTPFVWNVSDSQGNIYTPIAAQSFLVLSSPASPVYEQVVVYAAVKSSAAACTITVTNTGAGQTGTGNVCYALEVTSVAAPVFTPIFRLLTSADIPPLDATQISTGQLALARGGTAADLSATGGASQFLRQNSAGAAVTVIRPDFSDLSGATKISKYNNINTVSNGVPSEYATVDNITATANIGATTLYVVPASGAGLYRLSYYVIVNRAATTSSTLPDLQLTWTDPDNSTLQTFGPVDSATPSANTLTTMYSGTVIVSAKASTNIQYQTGVTTAYASVGGTSLQYSIRLKVEAL